MQNGRLWSVAVLSLALASPLARAATYYVDADAGNDSQAGNSMALPWKSLAKVNATDFQPGDRVLFKSGAVWRGQLAPKSSGAADAPIVFDRYGAGPKPKVDGEGNVEDVVYLHNVQQIEVRNFEITNHGTKRAARRGVHIFLENFGTAKHIVVSDLYIHDINGLLAETDLLPGDLRIPDSMASRANGGIIFKTLGDKVPSRFDGLTISRNLIRAVDRSGIAAYSYHLWRTRWFPSLHVLIQDNFVADVGGDGIVPWASEEPIVEHNIVRGCNKRAESYNAGIWPWCTDNAILQLNEASGCETTLDGQGFDSDYNSRNTLIQYNYSHDNEGGFLLICTNGKRKQEQNLGNVGTVVRYNISRNDKTRGIHMSGDVLDTTVEHNVFYVAPWADMQLLLVAHWDESWPSGAVFRDNTFHVMGAASFGHQVKRVGGDYWLAPGWGPAKGIVFEGNRYIGQIKNRPEDSRGVVQNCAPAPQLDWKGPEFDPNDADGFDAFMVEHRKWMMRLFEQQFGATPKLGRQ